MKGKKKPNLEIVSLTPKKQRDKRIPEPLPIHPFSCLSIARSFTGKTTTLITLITRKDMGYRQKYGRNIFVFSPTATVDKLWKKTKLKPKNFIDLPDMEDRIADIMLDQQELRENCEGWCPPILLIFDDCADALSKGKSLLQSLFFKGRHTCNCSIILTSQSYKSIPRSYRMNCSAMFLYRVNSGERKAIEPEMPIEPKVFRKYYKQATKDKPYHFLFINFRAPQGRQYYRNLTHNLENTMG